MDGLLAIRYALAVGAGFTWSKSYTYMDWSGMTVQKTTAWTIMILGVYAGLSMAMMKMAFLPENLGEKPHNLLLISAMLLGFWLDRKSLENVFPKEWSVAGKILPVAMAGTLLYAVTLEA